MNGFFMFYIRERIRVNFFFVVRIRLQNCNFIKYLSRVCFDNDLRVLVVVCKYKVFVNGVNLEEVIENYKRNVVIYKILEYIIYGMLFSNYCCK